MGRASEDEERADSGELRGEQIGGRLTGLVSGLILLTAVVQVMLAVFRPINQLTQPGGEFTVAVTGDPSELLKPVPGLPEGVWLSLDFKRNLFTLEIWSLPWPLRLLTELPDALVALSSAGGAFLVWQLLGTAQAGRPFDPRNPRRLVGLAVAVLVGGLGGQVLDLVMRTVILDHLGLGAAQSPVYDGSSFDLAPVAWAVVLLTLAETFRRGRRLAEDAAGLV